MDAILLLAAGVGLIVTGFAIELLTQRVRNRGCPDCRNDDWDVVLGGIDNVWPPRPRGFGRLPTPEARRYALEMIGDRYAQGEPFFIGDVPVTIAKVRNCPPTFAGTPTRSLRVVYPDGAEEYFEFETTGQIIYRGEISE